MKILHIFHHSDLKNGVDKTTCTLISALKKIGVESIAVIPKTGDVSDFLTAHQISYHTVDYSCCSSRAWRAGFRFLADSARQSERLQLIFKQEAPDVIHINTGHLLHAGLAAARCQIPAIWHIHAPFDNDLQLYQASIGKGGYQWLLEQLSTYLVGVSDDVSQSLAVYINSDRINTLYNGVDIEQLKLDALASSRDIRTELGLPATAKLVIGVGRISAQKGFASFARVASLVCDNYPDAFFIIAGPSEEQEAQNQLDAEIKRFNLDKQLFVLGPRNDVPSLVMQSNVFLSTAIFEGQGIAALEAMALEKPVVAMACQGLRECINHEYDGLLVSPADEDAAASSVLRLLNDSAYAKQLGVNGNKSVAQRFSSAEYAKQFLAIAESAKQSGSAPISEHALEMLEGLLSQINTANQRLLRFEQQTLIQHCKLSLWTIFEGFKKFFNFK